MAGEELGLTAAQLFGAEYVAAIFIFTIIFNSLVLWFLTKRSGFGRNGYRYAFLVTMIAAVVSLFFELTLPIWTELWMLPIYFAIDVILIYTVYPESLVKSVKTGFVWWGIAVIIGLVLGIVIGIILSVIGIAIGTGPFLAWLTG